MANPISLNWRNDGDWDAMMRGGRTSATTCLVSRSDGGTVYLQSHDGAIEEGDAVQNGIRYYKITSVAGNMKSFTIIPDRNYVPFQTNDTIIILKPKVWSEQDLCLETVLNQIGAYTYLVQYIFTNSVNVKDVNAIPARFYYPTKHKDLQGFLELIGQTLRAYWDFPNTVTGLDGFPVFIPQLIQISGVKMWQWVDKKLGYVLAVDKSKKTIKTRPVMQMPCGAMFGRNTFVIARKAPAPQRYYLAVEPQYPEDFHFGDLVRFYTTAPSMDWWGLPTDPIRAECSVIDVIGKVVRVRYDTGTFAVDDVIFPKEDESGYVYTITKIEKHPGYSSLTLDIYPHTTWPAGTILVKQHADVRVPGKRANPLIQKATGLFLRYEKRDPVRMLVKQSQLNWFTAQIIQGTPEVGDLFHVKDDDTFYTITKIEHGNFYCDPTPKGFTSDTELEITRSVMDFACGIRVPAYGEYYLSMNSSPLLYRNMTFKITGIDRETGDLIYDEGANWSPADTNSIVYCTHNIYKVGDFCYNGTTFPRTMEHLTELLYEYQRLITAMWDQIQIVGIFLTNNQTMSDWLQFGQNHLKDDPYWGLFFEGLS